MKNSLLLLLAAGEMLLVSATSPTLAPTAAPTALPSTMSTFAGTTAGMSGDGGPALSAQFNQTSSLWVDSSGNTFILDSGNCRIRKVSSGGTVSTVFGAANTAGCPAFGDGGSASSAGGRPYRLCGNSVTGDVYFTDLQSRTVRKISASSGIITTVAGNASAAYTYPPTFGVPSTSYVFATPTSCQVSRYGTLWVADRDAGYVVAAYDYAPGVMVNVVGDGQHTDKGLDVNSIHPDYEASIPYPVDLYQDDPTGYLYIACAGTAGVRKTGHLTYQRVAGNGAPVINWFGPYDGFYGLDAPIDLGAAPSLTGYTATHPTSGQHFTVLALANAEKSVVWSVVPGERMRWLAGNIGLIGYVGDGGAARDAKFNRPLGLAYNGASLLISDSYNSVVRAVYHPDVELPPPPAWPPVANIPDSVGSVSRVTPFAGDLGKVGFSGDGGSALVAKFNHTQSIWVDSTGNSFVADYNNCRIRKIAPNKIISTVFGGASCAPSGDGGLAADARGRPYRVCGNPSTGDVYFTDIHARHVRKISAATGLITTVAGDPAGLAAYTAPPTFGVNSTDYVFLNPTSCAVDGWGTLFVVDSDAGYIVKDYGGYGKIAKVIGDGNHTNAGLGGIPIDASIPHPVDVIHNVEDGLLYVACKGSGGIRYVTPYEYGTNQMVAGNGVLATDLSYDGGVALSSPINLGEAPSIAGISYSLLSSYPFLFVSTKETSIIQSVVVGGRIRLLAGMYGISGQWGDNKAGRDAQFGHPSGIAYRQNTLYIADTNNNQVRILNFNLLDVDGSATRAPTRLPTRLPTTLRPTVQPTAQPSVRPTAPTYSPTPTFCGTCAAAGC